jgi:hypothetical protein
MGNITGPVVLITLGGLFLLQNYGHWGFLWPALLIVIGIVQVLKTTASTEGHIPSGYEYGPQPPYQPYGGVPPQYPPQYAAPQPPYVDPYAAPAASAVPPPTVPPAPVAVPAAEPLNVQPAATHLDPAVPLPFGENPGQSTAPKGDDATKGE